MWRPLLCAVWKASPQWPLAISTTRFLTHLERLSAAAWANDAISKKSLEKIGYVFYWNKPSFARIFTNFTIDQYTDTFKKVHVSILYTLVLIKYTAVNYCFTLQLLYTQLLVIYKRPKFNNFENVRVKHSEFGVKNIKILSGGHRKPCPKVKMNIN